MKTLINSLVLVSALTAASFTAQSVTAAPKVNNKTAVAAPTNRAAFQASIYSLTSAPVVRVAVDKAPTGTVDVLLKNAKGEVVFTEHISKKQSQFRVNFNMSELEDGVYRVEITNGIDTTTHEFTISTKTPAVAVRTIAML